MLKRLFSFEHEVDGTPEFLSKHREGLGFAMFLDEPLMQRLSFGIIA